MAAMSCLRSRVHFAMGEDSRPADGVNQAVAVAKNELAAEIPDPLQRPVASGKIDRALRRLAAGHRGKQLPHFLVQPAVVRVVGAGDENPAGFQSLVGLLQQFPRQFRLALGTQRQCGEIDRLGRKVGRATEREICQVVAHMSPRLFGMVKIEVVAIDGRARGICLAAAAANWATPCEVQSIRPGENASSASMSSCSCGRTSTSAGSC